MTEAVPEYDRPQDVYCCLSATDKDVTLPQWKCFIDAKSFSVGTQNYNLTWKTNTKEDASPVKMEEGFRNEAKNADYFRRSSLNMMVQKESNHRILNFSDIIVK